MAAKKHDRWDAAPPDLIVATRHLFKQKNAVRRSIHALRAGSTTDEYADFDQMVCDPAGLKDVVELFAQRIEVIRRKTPVDFLAFMDKGSSGYYGATIGAVVLASTLSLRSYLPFVLIRMDRKTRSERVKMPAIRADGEDSLDGLNGILVTDHIGEGGETLEAIGAIRYVGGCVSHCIAYTCRDTSCADRFGTENVELSWAHPFPVPHAVAGAV
jgi:orotate phosphoribosyltransferase